MLMDATLEVGPITVTERQVKWLVIDCGVTLVVALKIALLVQKLPQQIPQDAKLRRVPRQATLLPHEQDPLRTSTTAT